jgi:hypothetical protein
MLYSFTNHRPGSWDIGINPTVNHDEEADPANQWKDPVGLCAGEMIKIGRTSVKLQLGMECAVVSENDFGLPDGIRSALASRAGVPP